MKTHMVAPNDSPGVILVKEGSDASWMMSKSIDIVTSTRYCSGRTAGGRHSEPRVANESNRERDTTAISTQPLAPVDQSEQRSPWALAVPS